MGDGLRGEAAQAGASTGIDTRAIEVIVTPDQLLDRLAAVRIDRSHGGRAPHKPLLLLALARVLAARG